MPFVDWEPAFYTWPDEEPDLEGLVVLHDAEGFDLLKCLPDRANVIAAALEYALADVAEIYGVGFGNLSDERVVTLLRRHAGRHPHVGLASVEPC